ncbi:MAG: DUF3486 family protein [Candidatus Lambdaproteobacteria bacterium]|nr:DUF3486 family protein [Candidatus Lambdaproteobacteria bacterium]
MPALSWQSEARRKAESAPQAVARKGGLSEETVQTIRRGILGVAG